MNLNKLPKILLIIVGVLLAVNILFLDWLTISESKSKSESKSENGTTVSEIPSLETKVATDSCGLVCQETIAERIQEELGKLTPQAGQSSVSPFPQPKTREQTNGKPKTVYVPLITDGTISSIDWKDIVPSEFYFDLSDYPSAKEVRFQAYLLSINNDLIYARVYDQSNKRGVDYSDIKTTSSTFDLQESSGMTIWRGNNKYTIQLRSVNGTQAQLKDAKLKIIF